MALLAILIQAQNQPNPSDAFSHYRPVAQAPVTKAGSTALSKLYRGPNEDEISLDNGLVRATLSLSSPGILKTYSRRSSFHVLTEATLKMPILVINESSWNISPPAFPSQGQAPLPETPNVLRFLSARAAMLEKPFEWQPLPARSGVWPPRGMGVKFAYIHPDVSGLIVELLYWLPDGSTSLLRRALIRNSSSPIRLQGRQWEWGQKDDPTLKLNHVIGPGTVYELPDQWVTLPWNVTGLSNSLHENIKQILPWVVQEPKLLRVDTLDQTVLEEKVVEAKSRKLEGLLYTEFDPSNQSEESRAALQNFVSIVRQAGQLPGLEVSGTRGFLPKDLVSDEGVCITSDSGNALSAYFPLAMARLGIKVVEFKGQPLMDCERHGHPHGYGGLARYENRKAWRGLVANLFSLGIYVKTPGFSPFGPEKDSILTLMED